MSFCNLCGAQIADGAVCAACASRPPIPAAPTSASAPGMTDNVAGMVAYFTFIPAIIFLVVEPYNKSRFIRFHSFQCIFLFLASAIAHFAIGLIPFMYFLTYRLQELVSLATLVLLILLALKANQGQRYKLPVLGDLAEKQANAM